MRSPGALLEGPAAGEPPEFDLRRHVAALWRRRWVVGTAVLALVVAVLFGAIRQSPVYAAEVKMLIKAPEAASLFDTVGKGDTEAERRISDEMELIKSEQVRQAVRRQVGEHRRVSVVQIGDTDVVGVKAQSATPSRSVAIARAYATEYAAQRRQRAIDALDSATRNLQAKIDELQGRVDQLNKLILDEQERQINRAVAARPGDPSSIMRTEPLAGLTAERNNVLAEQAGLTERRNQAQVDAELASGAVEIVTGDSVPTWKVGPRPLRSAAVALVLGLLLGCALALLLEYLDDSINTREDLERAVPDRPVLAVIPTASGRRHAGTAVAALAEPRAPHAEAYRSLRTALQFVDVERPPEVVQVTSCKAGEGKTSVVSNLGVVCAQAGYRVLLVDCDLRRPWLHAVFDLPNDRGFTSVFLDGEPVASAAQAVPEVDGLFVLAAGPSAPNPAEILSSKRTSQLLTSWRAAYDFVIVDCAPVLPVADAIALSTWVDATLLVVSAGLTTRRDLRHAHKKLHQAGVPLIGTVLNRVGVGGGYGYEYGPVRETRREHVRRRRMPARTTSATPAEEGAGDRATA